MSEDFGVLFGPKDDSDIPQESMGQYFFDCLGKKDPQQVANIDATTKQVLTYGELLRNSVKFAAVLQNLAITKDDVFSIVAENSIDYIVPILGALYVGAIVNPLNPAYATGELCHAFDISRPKLILCSESTIEKVLKVKQELTFVEQVLLMKKSTNHTNVSSVEELLDNTKVDTASFKPRTFDYILQGALVLLSSGTTGFPKGVLITHQNLRICTAYMIHSNYGNLIAKQTTIVVIPLFHIFGILISVTSIVGPLQLVIMEKFNPQAFLKCIEEHRVTKLYLVPPLINFLANSPLVDSYDTSRIRDILYGGSAVGQHILDNASKRLGNNPLFRQMYGMTEVTGAGTFQTISDVRDGSVGTLIPGAAAKIQIIGTCEKAGPLITGEVCFKGPMVMLGYMENERSVRSCLDEEGFYHTGDLGFYDVHNNFYIVGRLKELIKYKCFQVPPAELEALLMSHPDILDCGVIGIPDERAGELPFAFVVRECGSKLTENDVIQFVAERISIQKQLHGGVTFVNEIPKTPSGKVLRRILEEKFRNS